MQSRSIRVAPAEPEMLPRCAKPDYVWMGIGSPRQDHWVAKFRPLLEAPILLGAYASP
jgi:UDP-N-acetyl-D-mannosaminuronic acid transferase (WecB/TagA/CpsF family)